jgi:putative hemolysin
VALLASETATNLLALLATLLVSIALATLRTALLHSNTSRVLTRPMGQRRRERLAPLLEEIEPLIAGAGMLKIAADLVFLGLLLGQVAEGGAITWGAVALAVTVSVPTLLVLTETLPLALARRHGDALLVLALPVFHLVQWPLRPLVLAFEGIRRGILRAVGLPQNGPSTRQIVEGLRDVIEDAGRERDLDEAERELIENLMEFRDVDVAAVMTPRTEIDGVEVSEGLEGAMRLASKLGHSRVPVYEGSLDNILGTISAREMLRVIVAGQHGTAELRAHLRPAYFVPETKRISELLAEFRHERRKVAIVLDEYGGTAGLVTITDVLAEIVGDIDVVDEDEEEAIRTLHPGVAEVDASLHVSEVNEELGVQIPEEEDYETLAGFVLAQLGHFPKVGESFVHLGAEYEVLEASDRRVMRVRVAQPAAQT